MTAARALDDPSTSAADLAQIAQLQPGLRPHVAGHPNVYPGLTDWLAAQGVTPPAPVEPVVAQPAAPVLTPQAPMVSPIPSTPVATVQPVEAPVLQQPDGVSAKMRLRIPVNSPVPLFAGILLAICAVGVALCAIAFRMGSGSVWRMTKEVMQITSWNYAYAVGPIGRMSLGYPLIMLNVCWWVSAAMLLATAVLFLVSLRAKRLLQPALVLAGVSLIVHPVLWYVQLFPNWNARWQFTGLPSLNFAAGIFVAALGVVGGVLFIVTSTAHLGSRSQSVMKTALLVVACLELVAVIWAFQFWRYSIYSRMSLGILWVPILLFLLANVLLIVALSSNPAKTYYEAPERQRSISAASAQPAASAVPLYAMATMPDGSQQMVPVATQMVAGGGAAADAPSGGFATLGFFFPLIGLILFLVWKDQTPLKARSAGKGALIGVIVEVVGTVLMYVLLFVFLGWLGSLG